MKVALDTNILAYAEGTNGAVMRDRALDLIQRLPPESVVLPAQTLGELFNVLVRKTKRQPVHARTAVLSWCDAYPTVETSATVLANAADLASDHGLFRGTPRWPVLPPAGVCPNLLKVGPECRPL